MRYKCNDCDDYNLCYICYHGGKHNLGHSFRIIETPKSIGVNLPPRLSSRKCQLRGIFIGAKVVPGIDWDSEKQNKEQAQPGVVLDVVKFDTHNSWRSAAYVKWLNGETQLCRLGHEGHCDIQFVEAAVSDSAYYPEHLPVLGETQEQTTLQEVTEEEICEDEFEFVSVTDDDSFACISLTKKSSAAIGTSLGSNEDIDKLNKPSTSDERVKQLETKIAKMEESQTCPICLENKRNIIFLCGHSTCSICADNLVYCHLCRETIGRKIPIY